MGSERNILKRLLEGIEPDYVNDEDIATEGSEDLEEASFEAQGKIFKSAFGHYSCDGEPISREDYMKAKEMVDGNPGGSASSTPRQPKAPTKKAPKASPYESYKPEDFDTTMEDFEREIDDIVKDMRDTHPMERDDLQDRLDQMGDVLSQMEEYMSEEQYKRSDELRSAILDAEETEYEGPSIPDYDDPYQSRGLSPNDF